MNKHYKSVLIALIIIGFAVRFWKITTLPFPPDGDEVAFAYYGWSLLNFGSDEFGNKFPLYFSSIGDFKYPGLAYLNILPTLLFGLSDITTRFWSALSGVVLIPLVYFLAYFFTKNKKVSMFSSLIVTFSPWSIIESRIGYENHISFVLSLSGFLAMFAYFDVMNIKIKSKLKKYLISIAIILFLVSIITYAAQRIFIPSFLLTLSIFTFISKDFKKYRKNIFLIFLLISTVSTILSLHPYFRGRSEEEVWMFGKEQSNTLTTTYNAAGISPIKVHPRLTWLMHNKYSLSVLALADRYLDHFGPKFLFFEGEASDENVPNMGMLLFVEIILLPVGLVYLRKKDVKGRGFLLFAWLALSPIPSALTKGGAHINRASLMIVPLSIFSGVGLEVLTSIKPYLIKLTSTVIIFSLFIWSVFYTMHQIYVIKPVLRPWYKHQVNKELTIKVFNYKNNYDAVSVTDDDYIYYLFYGKITPSDFLKRAEILPLNESKWERVNRLDNIHFKMPFRCPLSGKKNVLYVCEGDEIPQNSHIVDIVYYWDGLPAYTFIEYYPLSERPNPLPKLPDRLHYMVDVEKPDGFPDGIIPKDHGSLW
jgi:hypothetical protein